MDVLMRSEGTRAGGTSRLGQGEQDDWSKGKRRELGLRQLEVWGKGSSRTESGGEEKLGQGEQKDWATGE